MSFPQSVAQSLNTPAERLKYLAHLLSGNLNKFAKDLKMSPSSIAKMSSGERNISTGVLDKLKDEFGISSAWIRDGEGPISHKYPNLEEKYSQTMTQDNGAQYQSLSRRKPEVVRTEDYIDLPFLDAPARAGFVEMTDAQNFGLDETFRVIIRESAGYYKGTMVVTVAGDSMEPRLIDGDRVLFKLTSRADWEYLPGGVYGVSFRNFFVIKRIKTNELFKKKELTLHSDNPETGGTMTVPLSQIQFIWQALDIVTGKLR